MAAWMDSSLRLALGSIKAEAARCVRSRRSRTATAPMPNSRTTRTRSDMAYLGGSAQATAASATAPAAPIAASDRLRKDLSRWGILIEVPFRHENGTGLQLSGIASATRQASTREGSADDLPKPGWHRTAIA